MDTKLKIFALALICLIEKIISQDCESYKCGKLDAPKCAEKLKFTDNTVNNTLQLCPDDNNYCPVNSVLINGTVDCIKKTVTTKKRYI
jgi:hypothetical protein